MVQKVYFGIDELGTIGTKGGFRSGSEYLLTISQCNIDKRYLNGCTFF